MTKQPHPQWTPPPNWPAPPSKGWVPPEGWTPDPAWGPAPDGWGFYPQQSVATDDEKMAKRRKINKRILLGVGSLLLLFILIGVFGSNGSKTDTSVTSSPSATTDTPATPSSPLAAPSIAPPVVISPVDALQSAIKKGLSDSNGNRKGVARLSPVQHAGSTYTVKFAVDENLTEGLTKNGMRQDVLQIIKAVKSAEPVNLRTLRIVGTYSLQDQYGAASEDTVVDAGYSRDVLGKIQPENVDYKSIVDLADGKVFIHPAFQY